MEILFTSDASISRADEIVDYLKGPRLWIPQFDYPDFDVWAAKVHRQLKGESKRAMMAVVNHQVVGVVIYQRHVKELDTLEVKNLTVRPDQRGRHIASFLLRNAELEGAEDFATTRVVADTKEENAEMRFFLQKQGYASEATLDLYQKGRGRDVVYRKSLFSVKP